MTAPVVLNPPPTPYVPSNLSPFQGAEALWLTNELQKLQRSIASLIAAVNQLAAAI